MSKKYGAIAIEVTEIFNIIGLYLILVINDINGTIAIIAIWMIVKLGTA